MDFCDYFWGEKHDGYHVLHSNLKAGFMATKELADTLRETALIQENNSKVETLQREKYCIIFISVVC